MPEFVSLRNQSGYIRQFGNTKFVAKNKSIAIATNLSTVVYAGYMRKGTTTAAKASGYVKGNYLWTSGKVSGGSVTYRRLTNGTQSGMTFFYELWGQD